MTLGKRIEWWRLETGLSKAETARRVEVSDVAVSYWETGDTSPTQAHLAKFCEVVGITQAEFWASPPKRQRSAS